MSPQTRFKDRIDAGRRLADDLREYEARDDVIVLALPRGGVPVGFEVARELRVPLDILLVRKLGVPGQPELAMGAIASGGVRIIRQDLVRELGIPEDAIARVAADEEEELERRERAYRGDRPDPPIEGRAVILVDDGLATGSTMNAAAAAVRARNPAGLVIAAPVGASETCDEFRESAGHVVCSLTPEPFRAVGVWYADFPAVTDDEVRTVLARAEDELPAP